MEPRTKEEKEVVKEHCLLAASRGDGLSARQREWITEHAFDGLYIRVSDKHSRCCGCGTMTAAGTKVCPVCGNRLQEACWGGNKQYSWVATVDSWKRWQIIRVVEAAMCYHCGKRSFAMCVIYEKWVSETGKVTVMARDKMPFMCEYFRWATPMSVKKENREATYYNEGRQYSQYRLMCPYGRVQREFRRRGLWKAVRSRSKNVMVIAEKLLRDNLLETMLKVGLMRLADARASGMAIPEHCWKLAVRYRYEPEKMYEWRDYIGQLEELGRDTHNPKVLMPENLEEAHNRFIWEVQKKRESKRLESRRKELLEHEDEYRIMKGALLAVTFSGGGLRAHVLQNPMEFEEEGTAMHHCVAGYWRHEHSCILSVRDEDDRRVETVEVDLRSYTIVQSQGPCNKPTKRHDEVLRLVTTNMDLIRKAAC